MNQAAIDKRHGRRGGGWTTNTNPGRSTRLCDVCSAPMTCDQPGRHWSCSPVCEGCHRPYGPRRQNCNCNKKDTTT